MDTISIFSCYLKKESTHKPIKSFQQIMKKYKEHLQEKVTREFGGIYEPNGIKDIKTYENPNINITGMATYDLKNMTNLITKKLLELTKEARMLEKDYNKDAKFMKFNSYKNYIALKFCPL